VTYEPTCDTTKHRQIDTPKTGGDDRLHDDAPERLDFPADGRPKNAPCTCLTHVGEVHFAAQDDGGRLARLSNRFFDRLRKMCL
jgi:hypothetical protein